MEGSHAMFIAQIKKKRPTGGLRSRPEDGTFYLDCRADEVTSCSCSHSLCAPLAVLIPRPPGTSQGMAGLLHNDGPTFFVWNLMPVFSLC